MDVTAELDAPGPPSAVRAWVDDLERYPAWLDIVARAHPLAADSADPGPAWEVDLRGRLGPFARSKRLRMVRMSPVAARTIRFERRELDGRSHAAWVLEATVEESGGGSRLTMRLAYDGRFVGPVIERALADEIERARPRLRQLVAAGPPEGG